MMASKDKLCLRLNDFETNIRESFIALRKEENCFDVTLASDDGQHIEAHQIILAAGSTFFSKIFNKTQHHKPYIYMRGIEGLDLESIISFLYNGETYVEEESLDRFLGLAEELQVKGLQVKLTQENVKCVNQESNIKPKISETEGEIPTISVQESVLTTIEELPGTLIDKEASPVKIEETPTFLMTNQELDIQIEQMMEKTGRLWTCKMCGKIANRRLILKDHIETHIEGVSHACHICSKISTTRNSLKVHLIDFHNNQSFTCTFCGKVGMTKMRFKAHKKKCKIGHVLS